MTFFSLALGTSLVSDGWFWLIVWMIDIGFGSYALGELIDRLALSKPGNGPLSWF